jgi:hypothetical protein
VPDAVAPCTVAISIASSGEKRASTRSSRATRAADEHVRRRIALPVHVRVMDEPRLNRREARCDQDGVCEAQSYRSTAGEFRQCPDELRQRDA